MRIHLEGLGLVGSLLAIGLAAEGVRFTWNDTDEEFTAWKASTGCVFPTEEDFATYSSWMLRIQSGSPAFMSRVSDVIELGRWCYIAALPPHGGSKVGIQKIAEVGPLKISSAHSLHVNVQRLVKRTRRCFAEQRRSTPPSKSLVIITHGDEEARHFVWGWSAKVDVRLSDELQTQIGNLVRPCLYLRKGYAMTYLYPLPGTSHYYGGTSTIVQKSQRHRDPEGHYRTWKEDLRTLTGGHARVTGYAPASLREGWRPAPEPGAPQVRRTGARRIVVAPQAGNGLRHFPLYWNALAEELNL